MFRQYLLTASLILIFTVTAPIRVLAQKTDDARLQYLCALMSMAAYDDKFSALAQNALNSYGWEFNFFKERENGTSAKFFIARNESFMPGEDSYLLAIRGTSDVHDIASDMKISFVPFGGATPAEFSAFAARPADPSLPMVHSGFDKYVQTALFTPKPDTGKTLGEKLRDTLNSNPSAHLYITGHSLGGAAAILAATRLISLGADPHRISVITFGAPAVGNDAFAKTYGPDIDLLRIVMSGDPIRNLAQIFNSNYNLFGRELKYPSMLSYDDKLRHKILLYADMSLRRYYQAKSAAPVPAGEKKIFFAKPVFRIPAEQTEENVDFYIRAVLGDVLSHYINGIVWSNDSEMPPTASSYKYIVHTDISIARQKYEKNSYYAALSYTVYDARSGQFLTSLSAASDTAELTPIEAILYDNIKLQSDLIKVLK